MSFYDAADHHYRDEFERGRTRALQHRLSRLMQENARMRDTMLDKHTGNARGAEGGVDDALRQNLELIAALLAKNKGAEKKPRRTQNNARILQVQVFILILLRPRYSDQKTRNAA